MKKALVAGASGVIGRYLVSELSKSGWDVVGLSRSVPSARSTAGLEFLAVDLLDRDICLEAIRNVRGITHVFYAAYLPATNWIAATKPNREMFANFMDAVNQIPTLKKCVLVTGGKAYGFHLGPAKTPAKESDPRHMPPNFYFDQADYLKAVQKGNSWSWTELRPHTLCGYSPGTPMNLLTVIAMYASISKELGLPLRFPGKARAYDALYQVTDAEHFARAMVWAAGTTRGDNEAFNATNGDFFRWKDLWPKFAAHFGMEYAAPQTISLKEFMSDKSELWEQMVRKYGLKLHSFAELAAWDFGDYAFAAEWDVMSSTTKIRQAGFGDVIDSEEMFLRLFTQLDEQKIIPLHSIKHA
jgi:nucleoside-diphosphate-sugar epimerase